MTVAVAFTPADWQVDIGGSIAITGLGNSTSYDVLIYKTGTAPAVNPTIGGTSDTGYGGGHIQRYVSDGSGNITFTWVPQDTQPVNVAVYAIPVQQGSTATVNVVSGE